VNGLGNAFQIFSCGSYVDVDGSLDLVMVDLGGSLNLTYFNHIVEDGCRRTPTGASP
jgi:hypothetical protein